MGEIVNIDNSELEIVNDETKIVELTEKLLMDARSSINNGNAISFPIAELSTLGAGVSSLIPTFNTVTQSTTIATDGLYQIANRAVGDTLKMAKNGNAWGAMKTASGSSKMVQLTEAGPLSATTQSVAAFNPATLMMAAALYSIEKDLKEISKTQKKILAFLEVEYESQIEADIKTLVDIVTNYKYTWDNELSLSSAHNQVVTIQNRARKNMIAYKKRVDEIVSTSAGIVNQNKIDSVLYDLEKKFKYYRLSLYAYSLASMLEIMLSGNFKEEYITKVKDEIKSLSMEYRHHFKEGSLYLEELSNSGITTGIMKKVGSVSKVAGNTVGKIPFMKGGDAEEILHGIGDILHENAEEKVKETVKAFKPISDPETKVFVEKLEDISFIYNQSSKICFDKENVYFIDGKDKAI